MSGLPSEHNKSLKVARESLASTHDGQLILGSRQRIWAAMGPLWHLQKFAIPAEGLERRAALAIACVNHVLPLWEECLPDDRSPHDLLTLIGRYLRGEVDPETVGTAGIDLWTHVESLGYRDRGVLGAALSVGDAASDENFDPASIDPKTSDEDRDAYEWDAASYVAIAYAGGNPISYAKQFDPARLRAFWAWYLDVAVPAAWRGTSVVVEDRSRGREK
jgi:Immunity protein Imm5